MARVARLLYYNDYKIDLMKKTIKGFATASLSMLLMVLISYGCETTNRTTATTETENVGNISQGSDWVFTANTAIPQKGSTRQLSIGFNVTLNQKKLVVYLPYYGQAYTGADLFSGKGPLDFTSTDFTIERTAAKKGGWNISIKPRDYKEVQSMEFTFYDNGTAYLNVSMQNRSSINFNGTVEQVKS